MSVLTIVKESLSGFNRAKFAAVSSIMTIMISLLFLGIFYVIADNTSRLVGKIREKVEMEAFLEEPATAARAAQVEKALLALDGVERVEFVSKDDAAKIFREEFGEDILSVLDANPLPASFKIFLKESYRTPEMAERLHEQVIAVPGVQADVFRRDMLQFIQKQSRTLYLAGLGLGLFIAISAIILVSNTIRLAIDAKVKDVQTMKLVGASRWFIRAPFILEGLIQGVLGGMLAALVMYYLLTFVTGLISGELAEFLHAEFSFYGMVTLAGTCLGLLGSLISVRRFISDAVAG
jgi:cell division transport system permease protein